MAYNTIAVIAFNNTSFQLDPKDLISIDFGIVTRDDNCSLSFGVIEQNVSIKFHDRQRMVASLLSSGTSISGNIVVNEVDNNKNVKDSYSYEINDVSIDDSLMEVTLKGIDATRILDNIVIPKSQISTKTAHDLLTTFFSYVPNFNWKYYDNETETKCKHISTPRCWYREDTLRNFLDKVCTLAFLKIFYKDSIFYVMGGVV